MAKNNTKGRAGRGWFGNSAGHAAAGRKGGKARSRNRSSEVSTQSDEVEMSSQ